MIKRILTLLVCIIMVFTSATALAAEGVNTFLSENFNTISNGGKPEGDFIAKRAGNADLAVVEIPDAKNKSICMKGAEGGEAVLEGSVVNPDLLPITISFRFMLPSLCNLSFPTINDGKGNSSSLLNIENGVLKASNTVISDIKAKRWYYVETSLNLSENTYRVSLDGNFAESRLTFKGTGVAQVAFRVNGANTMVYFDDLMVSKTTVGGKDRESWPSKMWTTDAQQQVVDDISLSNFTMFNASKVAYKNGVKMEMPAPVLEMDNTFYVPLRFVAENIGAEVVWNNQENAVYMMFGGKTTKLSANSGEVYVDGTKQSLSSSVKAINGTTYIAYKDIASLLGREVNEKDGYIMFGPDWEYYNKAETAVKEELYRMVKYQRPTGQDIIDAVIKNNPNNSHPRLFGKKADFERIKNLWTTDEFAKKALNYLQARANEYLVAKVTPYVQPGSSGRMYSVRRPHEIINTCGLMYHLTGDERYAKRVKDELMNMISFPELGHISILDLGDTGECMGVAYDWIYDYLTEADRKAVRDAIREKFLPPLIGCYRGDNSFYNSLRMTWVYSRYNFNSHINTGAVMCLLPMIEDFDKATIDEYIRPIFGYLMRSVEFFFDEWYPDGGWHEGPGYGTAVIYQLAHFIDALDSAAGTTFGLSDVPGLIESGIWGLHMEGPAGAFNFSDAGEGKNAWSQYSFWMSDVLDEDIFAAKRREDLDKDKFQSLEPIEMLWYNPSRGLGYTPLDDLDAYFRGIETVTMRSGWGQNDIYGGLHSGLNGINHAHIDTGSFIFDWNGSRWVNDIGVDSATSHWYAGGVNDWGVGYRERAEGHNTLVFDDTPYRTYGEGEWPIVFEDDFEDYTIDEDPSKFKIAESNSNTNAQGEVGVVNVERAKIGDNAQNKAMRLEMSREKKTSFYAHKSFGVINEDFAKSALELTFKFKLDKFDESGDMNFINFYSPDYTSPEGVATPHGTVFGLNIQKGYVLRSQNGSSYVTLKTLDPTKWYDMKFVVDVKSQTMNIWIDGEHLGKNLKLPKTIVGISYVRFSSSTNVDFEAYLDDVVIRVSPEDSALALTAAKLYDQTLYCNSPITDYVSKEKGAYAVTDMTQAYISWVNSAKRGIMLTNNRNAFIVRDEVELKNKADVYWFAHSKKENVSYTISEDGKSAILENPKNKSKVWVGLLSDVPGAKFTVMEADPLPGSPRPSNQADNSMFHKLTIKFEGAEGKLNFSVAFIPLDTGETKPVEIPKDASFAEWSIPDGSLPKLDNVTLNGVQIENFEPEKTGYYVNIRSDEEVPKVAAVYQGREVEVEQAASLNDYASFAIQNGDETINYRINFIVEEVTYGYIQGHPITDDAILYSSITAPEYPPKRLIDGDTTTECASLGDGEWFLFDFKEPREFSKLEIMWCYAEGRNYDFEILYSDDAINWKSAFSGKSTGVGDVFDTYEFDKSVTGRYLKFIGHGNNKNLYNNIYEIR